MPDDLAEMECKGSPWWCQANTVIKPDASPGCAPACPEAGVLYPLESLIALNSTEATERGAPSRLQCPQRHQRFNPAHQLEHTIYDPAGRAKFEQMQEEGYLDLVYENERVKIYWMRK
jgi:hypothetical protein